MAKRAKTPRPLKPGHNCYGPGCLARLAKRGYCPGCARLLKEIRARADESHRPPEPAPVRVYRVCYDRRRQPDE